MDGVFTHLDTEFNESYNFNSRAILLPLIQHLFTSNYHPVVVDVVVAGIILSCIYSYIICDKKDS